MDTTHTLFQVLTLEGIPWAQVDEQAQIILATPQECALLAQGRLPLPEGCPWPPEFPGEGGAAGFPLADGSAWLAWPLEDGSFLVVAHRYWQQRIEREREQRAKFISVVTHELRLPLTSIKGYADLLTKGLAGPLTERQARFVEVIHNNVQRMAVLLDRLSDMGRLASGRLKIGREPVAVAEVLRQVVERYAPLCRERRQSLHLQIPQTLPPVQGDPRRLVQVVEALTDNAHRYTPQGGEIILGARQAGDMVQIWVRDTGIGITPQDQAHLFEPVFRSEDQAVRDHHGWGLSLHVAALLVKEMGGRIEVESTPGQGSCFTVSLPLYEQLDEKP